MVTDTGRGFTLHGSRCESHTQSSTRGGPPDVKLDTGSYKFCPACHASHPQDRGQACTTDSQNLHVKHSRRGVRVRVDQAGRDAEAGDYLTLNATDGN